MFGSELLGMACDDGCWWGPSVVGSDRLDPGGDGCRRDCEFVMGRFVEGVMPRLMMDGTFVQGTPGTNMTKDNDLLGKDYLGLRPIRIGGYYTSTS